MNVNAPMKVSRVSSTVYDDPIIRQY